MNGTGISPSAQAAPLVVSHVADYSRRYPGEELTFYTCVEVNEPLAGFTLRVTLPPGLALEDYGTMSGTPHVLPLITWDDGANHLNWTVDGELQAPARFEYRAQVTVAPTQEDRVLASRAVVTAETVGEESIRNEETATVILSAQGRYLQHLPAVYQRDELLGRFLMLFESFWAPVERQIDYLSLYFDPRMAPPEFLPWLASWLDLVLDERWPEERRRMLVRSAACLYRKRGTRRGLEEYLEIYTGRTPKIVEHRAHNLRLGPESRLGPGIALGKANVPHTFTVILRLPPISLSEGEQERERLELERRHKIEAIIEAEKPAHTAYTLRLEVEPEPDMRKRELLPEG